MVSISLFESSIFLLIAWIIFLALTGLVLLAPADELQSRSLLGSFLGGSASKWREVLLSDMKQSPAGYQSVRAFVHSSSILFLSYWKELTLIALALQFSPTLKGIIYCYTPPWILNIASMIQSVFSWDDEQLPDLEPDPDVVGPPTPSKLKAWLTPRTSGKSERSRSSASLNFLDTAASDVQSESSSKNGSPSSGRRHHRRISSGEDLKRHVFDPIYGVVPEEVRNLWRQQELLGYAKRNNAIKAAKQNPREKQLPPVRYSSIAPVAAATSSFPQSPSHSSSKATAAAATEDARLVLPLSPERMKAQEALRAVTPTNIDNATTTNVQLDVVPSSPATVVPVQISVPVAAAPTSNNDSSLAAAANTTTATATTPGTPGTPRTSSSSKSVASSSSSGGGGGGTNSGTSSSSSPTGNSAKGKKKKR